MLEAAIQFLTDEYTPYQIRFVCLHCKGQVGPKVPGWGRKCPHCGNIYQEPEKVVTKVVSKPLSTLKQSSAEALEQAIDMLLETSPGAWIANYWITPAGRLVKVTSEDHAEYVIEHPRAFKIRHSISEEPAGKVLNTAVENGAIRIAIYSVGAGVEGTPEALRKYADILYALLIKFRVEKLWIEGERHPISVEEFAEEYL